MGAQEAQVYRALLFGAAVLALQTHGSQAQNLDLGALVPLDAPNAYYVWDDGARSVGASGGGYFALAWRPQDLSSLSARVFDAWGQPASPVISVAQAPVGMKVGCASVDVNDSGDEILIGWHFSSYPGVTTAFQARRFRLDGTPKSGVLSLSDTSRGCGVRGGLNRDGSLLASWGRWPRTVMLGDFDPQGDLVQEWDVGEGNGNRGMTGHDWNGRAHFFYAADQAVRVIPFDSVGRPQPNISVRPDDVFCSYALMDGVTLPGGDFALTSSALPYSDLDQRYCFSALSLSLGSSFQGAEMTPDYTFHPWFVEADAPGNLAVLAVTEEGALSIHVVNPLGVLAAAVVRDGTSVPGSAEGLMNLGPGRFGVIWRDGTDLYLQSATVSPASTHAPSFYTVTPCRLRHFLALKPFDDATSGAAGFCEIPSDARAIAATFTVANPTHTGNLRFYRPDQIVPAVASLSYTAGVTRSGNGVIALDENGRYAFRVTQASGQIELFVETTGYFK